MISKSRTVRIYITALTAVQAPCQDGVTNATVLTPCLPRIPCSSAPSTRPLNRPSITQRSLACRTIQRLLSYHPVRCCSRLNSWLPFGDKLLGRAQDSTRHLWKWECASWCSQELGEIPPTTWERGARTAAAKQVWGSWLFSWPFHGNVLALHGVPHCKYPSLAVGASAGLG